MSRPRVVLAEDEALIRLDLRECLTEEGYEVVGEAADGAQAVAMVREQGADVAILDVMMPGVDGLTAAREIMIDRLAAVVILTAYSQRDLVEQARDAGAMAYLIKPFQREELVPAIELAVARFRELEILAHVAEGLTNQEIADRLTISKRTVDNHVSNIFTKTGAKNRVALLNWAMDHGKICRDGVNCCALEPNDSDTATRVS